MDICSEDLILWPMGVWCYRDEFEEFSKSHGDDWEVVLFGSSRYELFFKRGVFEEY
jgi:hypothetical protein